MTDEENDEIRMTKLEGMTRLRQGFGVAGPPSRSYGAAGE